MNTRNAVADDGEIDAIVAAELARRDAARARRRELLRMQHEGPFAAPAFVKMRAP